MKKSPRYTLELNQIAAQDARCAELEAALLESAKPVNADSNGKPAQHWTTQFQASGGKAGQKFVD